MKVKVVDYGFDEEKNLNFVNYKVSGLDADSQTKLRNLLEEETKIVSGELLVTVHYEKEYFPFGSDEAAIRMDDFIAREEIEMTVFLSSVLQD